MNILIIGAGGFIGSHLCEYIAKNRQNWSVTAVDICLKKIEHLFSYKNFSYFNVDVLKDFEKLEEKIQENDIIFPLAAIANPSVYITDPLKIFELDFESNIKVIKSAVKYKKRIIFPSTSEVYGMCEDKAFDELTSNCITGPVSKQRWIYSCSKQMLDRVIYAYGKRDNLSYTLFRPFNWIGPRLDDIYNQENGSSRVVTQFLSNILYKKDINLVDGGDQIRCFTYISDAIEALITIIENENNIAEKAIFNIGNPYNEISIKNLALKILELAKNYDILKDNLSEIKIVNKKANDYYGKGYQDVLRRVPSILRAETILNWHPKVTIDEALQKTMDFYFL